MDRKTKARRALSPIALVMMLLSFGLATDWPTGALRTGMATALLAMVAVLAAVFWVAKPWSNG